MSITETALEMHFHRPLMDLIRTTFGLGNPGGLNFYKYSPQKECFVGFDQAYAKSELTAADFFSLLSQSASSANYRLRNGDRFLGYFLQFKVVREMQRSTRYTPEQIVNYPHYRVGLDTFRNKNTGRSQHELLFNLSRNSGAFVYYACPMLFDRFELYDIDVDLDKLVLADVSECSSVYEDNGNHFIFFDSRTSAPVWCSEPHIGKAISPSKFAQLLHDRANAQDGDALRQALFQVLTKLLETNDSDKKDLELLADAFTIIRVSSNAR